MAEKIEKVGRVSGASVLKGTGKDWNQWITILNKKLAQTWSHREIAIFLKEKYQLTTWWQRGVAIGFELHHGRRQENRNAKGQWSLTVTASVHAPAGKVWKWLISEPGQKIWLSALTKFDLKIGSGFETEGGYFGEIRTFKTQRRLRLTFQESEWEKPSMIEVFLVERPKQRCLLAIGHSKLANNRLQIAMRQRWRTALDSVAGYFGGT